MNLRHLARVVTHQESAPVRVAPLRKRVADHRRWIAVLQTKSPHDVVAISDEQAALILALEALVAALTQGST
jgi:hypothetical protein